MASIDALKQSFNSSDRDPLLEPCSQTAFSDTSTAFGDTSTAPSNYEALQYIPQSHSPHMPSHVGNNILDSPNNYDNMISSLQQEDGTVPSSSALSDPMNITNVCDIWSLFGEPPVQLDATHKPDYASHTPHEIHFQEDLQLPPPPSFPMDTIQAYPTHSATVSNDTDSSAPACLKPSTWKYFAKKPSDIISKPLPLSSSSSEFQRRNRLKPICSSGSLKDNAEKVDNITSRMLKNQSYERRRRKKLNDKLYSLRVLVPKISKMDKASIVSDAIEHVQDLQKQVALRQQEISSLRSRLDAGAHGTLSTSASAARSTRRQHRPVFSTCIQPGHLVPAGSTGGYHQHKVLKMEVVKMEDDIYQLIIECAKGKCTVVQLIRALEALHFDILSANLTSIGDRFLNTLVLKVKILKPKELREIILEILPKFGLILCEKEGRKNA